MIKEIKKEIGELKTDKKILRDFGILLFVVLSTLFSFFYFKKNEYLFFVEGLAALFLLLGFLAPNFLRPPYLLWMGLGLTLGWIVTRLILIFTFYFLFTPISFLLKIFKKDLLNQKVEKETKSYWQKPEKISDKRRYEKQF